MTRLSYFTLLVLMFVPGPANGADQLQSLGQQTLQMSTGRQLIDLSHRREQYSSLRLKVLRGRLLLSKLVVTYGDGSQHIEKRRINLLNKERTRPINPLESARSVKTVLLIWTIRRSDPQTTVIEILGLPLAPDDQSTSTAGPVAATSGESKSNTGSGPGGRTCKQVVAVSGEPAWTKIPTAYLNSLRAWQKTVQARYGSGYKVWRGAKGRTVKCYTGQKEGKPGWICTHSGTPCDAKPRYIKN